MFDLWLGVAFLLVIALGFICMPLFMSLRGSELKRQASNVVIYKSQLEDLKADLESGRIEQAEYDSLSKEINLNLLVDTEEQKQVESNQSGNWIFIPSVALILVVSIGLYMKLGAENELAITQMLQASNQSGFTREDAGKLIERLKVQTQDTPEDIEMWYLYGRLNFDLGQFDQAVVGFTQALQLLPIDAQQDQAVAMAQLAQAQFFANDRRLDAATESLLKDVLAINPNDETSLGLLGVASYDSGRYVDAVNYWQRLVSMMPASNPNVAAIQGGINKALEKMTPADRKAIEEKQKAMKPAVISITVDLADSIKGYVPESADVFVLAKAQQGPPMPLAVQRLTVKEWPITVVLDDSMAMMPALRLSHYDNVVITARISKSGVGNVQAGDIQGVSPAISSQTKSINVTINEIVE